METMRLYFRRRGEPKTRLPAYPGPEEFMVAYQEALGRTSTTKAIQRRLSAGSFGFLCRQYFTSQTFKALDESTRNWRRRALNEIALEHEDKPVAKMQAKHVRQLRDEKADKPGAAGNRLKALRALFRWAQKMIRLRTTRRGTSSPSAPHRRPPHLDVGRNSGV